MVRRRLALLRELDLLSAVAILVIAAGTVQLFAGALSTGVTIDEPIEVDESAGWIHHGWYLPEAYLANGEPDSADELGSPYIYGPAFAAIAHAANVLGGNESIGEVAHSPGSYKVRHAVSAALAALAVAAVGAAVSFLSRSRRLGLWAAAGLLAVPAWTGHGFFNAKDIPGACGYLLVTVALLFAIADGPDRPATTRRQLAIAATLASGIFIGAGTRLTLLVPFLLSLVVYAALRIAQRRLGGVERDRRTDLAVLLGSAAGYGGIAVLYHKAASAPFTLLTESVSGSSAYPWHGFTLTAGQLLSQNPPWWYLPAWIGASYPLLLGGLAILGAGAAVWALVEARGRRWRGPVWSRSDLGLVFVLQQALLLPVGAMVIGAVMYDGMRQHLYVLPALAILAGVGASRLWTWSGGRSSAKRWRTTATALLAVALLVPMIEQTLLFPYNYVYVNPVAGLGGVSERWETDYWFASGPEAGSHIPSRGQWSCLLEAPAWQCDEDQIARIEGERGADVKERSGDQTSGIWLILRRHNRNPSPERCKPVDNVTRWLRGERVLISYVARCY